MFYTKQKEGKYRIAVIAILFIGLSTAYWFCLPKTLFNAPCSTILTDRNNELLSARIARDGQWRFPQETVIPDKFKKAIITFEDKRFYDHPGIDIFAIARAFKLNIKNKEIISGGSTLSMQVIRLARNKKNRGIYDKIIETIMATRLELTYSKEEILSLYCSHAPFGGNVVGLETASWKYYGSSAKNLSWGETATLAVLPNSPGLIHPGKNRAALKTKRDKLLTKLYNNDIIDSVTCMLAQQEQLPDKPLPLPDYAPHLVERIIQDNKNIVSVFQSSLELKTQCYAQKIINKHYHQLKENKIQNAAALIIDTKSGKVLAYIGNTPTEQTAHEQQVDMVTAKRSTGSILKPLLYAMMMNEGYLLPNTLIPDIPSWYGKYTPKNFTKDYHGAIPVNLAIAKSLNVPAVKMLNEYGVRKFHSNLKTLGMTTLHKEPAHYGLSLILGGAETTLEDIAGIYAGMGRSLLDFKNDNQYKTNLFRKINYTTVETNKSSVTKHTPLNASAIWYTFEAMNEVVRPTLENNWETYSVTNKVAWKTGTSFGSRDAWAVGCTPDYTIAVWAGNATGEGRPGISGIEAAAPILFDLFSGLERKNTWFEKPLSDMTELKICKKSGHKASEICTETDLMPVPASGIKTSLCPYHKLVYLDNTAQKQVSSECYAPSEMQIKSYFILPPIQELYYKAKNPDYVSPPAFMEACVSNDNKTNRPEILYPTSNSKIYIPVNLDGTMSEVVFQANHPNSKALLYWHIDDEFIGETKETHDMALHPSVGKHLLTIITENGEVLKQQFEVISKL